MNLTTPFPLPANANRLLITSVVIDDESLQIAIELKTPIATNQQVSRVMLRVRNGRSDRVSRATLVSGDALTGALLFERLAVATPAGLDNAVNAWRAGATPQARRDALELHLVSAGVIHSSLAGT